MCVCLHHCFYVLLAQGWNLLNNPGDSDLPLGFLSPACCGSSRIWRHFMGTGSLKECCNLRCWNFRYSLGRLLGWSTPCTVNPQTLRIWVNPSLGFSSFLCRSSLSPSSSSPIYQNGHLKCLKPIIVVLLEPSSWIKALQEHWVFKDCLINKRNLCQTPCLHCFLWTRQDFQQSWWGFQIYF